MRLYLDGELQGEIPIESNRWAVLNSSVSGERQGFLLFTDDTEETQPLYLASLQFRDYELDGNTIASLGTAKNEGIKTGNADLWNVTFPDVTVDFEILDYDNNNHHIWLSNPNIGEQVVQFQPSKNATTSSISGTSFDWSQGIQSITVTSEDRSKSKVWNIILHQSTVGIDEYDNQKLTIYPNPTQDFVNVSLDSNQPGELTLQTLDGVTVKTTPFKNGNQQLDLRNLSRGYYVIKIKTKDNSFSKKLLKI